MVSLIKHWVREVGGHIMWRANYPSDVFLLGGDNYNEDCRLFPFPNEST